MRRVQLLNPRWRRSTIRKVIKECLDKGVFENTPEINRRPLVDHVPWEIAKNYKTKARKGHQTIRYSPATNPTRHQSYSSSQENSKITSFWTHYKGTSEQET